MPQTVKILRLNSDTGEAFVEFTDNDGTSTQLDLIIPIPESGPVDETYILDKLGEVWPYDVLDRERNVGGGRFMAGDNLVNDPQDLADKIPPKPVRGPQ